MYVNTAAAQSFDCTFPNGPATSTVTVTVDDGAAANNVGTAATQVAVAAAGGATPTPTPTPSPIPPPTSPGPDGELPDTALPLAAPLTLIQLLVAAVVAMGAALALSDGQSASPAQRARRRR